MAYRVKIRLRRREISGNSTRSPARPLSPPFRYRRVDILTSAGFVIRDATPRTGCTIELIRGDESAVSGGYICRLNADALSRQSNNRADPNALPGTGRKSRLFSATEPFLCFVRSSCGSQSNPRRGLCRLTPVDGRHPFSVTHGQSQRCRFRERDV